MAVADLDLLELLELRPEQGRIMLGDQRMLLWSADAFGNLRKELIDNLGVAAARGILRRFGFANGYRDALVTRELFDWSDERAWWLSCPALQAHEGKVRPEIRRLEIDRAAGHFVLEVDWHRSYEAAQHLRVASPAADTACWTLTGYASGFSSAVMGEDVYAVERACLVGGGTRCRVVARTRREWGAEGDRLAADYAAPDLAHELAARAAELRSATRRLRRRERELRRLGVVDLDDTGLVGRSRALEQVVELATRVAAVDATVLITGETGVGKERIARLIHAQSGRARAELIAINCGALPETLLESELFGHVAGAFTGATADKPGLFEAATGGTLFLDEVGELSPATQVKLLRVLQEREVRAVGATATRPVDVRIVAATHRDLAALVADGRFRHDLYYRLDVVSIAVPPLRERRDDILPLARHFVTRACAAYRQEPKRLTAQAARLLAHGDWPGNVRQLQHAIEHAVILAGDEPHLRVEHLPAELTRGGGGAAPDGAVTLDEAERRHVLAVLDRCGGHRAATARALGIGTNTLWRKLRRWQVAPARASPSAPVSEPPPPGPGRRGRRRS